MKTETKTIYKCDYCNKIYFRKHFCIEHEKRCNKNPVNKRVCLLCPELELKVTTLYFDTQYGCDTRKIDIFYCKKINSFLYPPKVEHKKNWFLSEDLKNETPNVPMKKECKIFIENQKKVTSLWK